MASEKKPSIYYDRGTIGSSAELDEYGVWVKSEPQDLSFAGAENQESDLSFEDDADLSDADFSGAADIAELPDLDLPAEDSFDAGFGDMDFSAGEDFSGTAEGPGADDTGAGGDTADGTAGADMDAFFDDMDDDSAEPEVAGFTEVSTDDFLESGETEKDSGETAEKPRGTGDLSTQLLMKIAEELSSIRTELTTLKKEFASVRGETAEEHGEPQARGGFFDEEDDEKIALTGDELDNILNTADFTEETGSDATEELSGGGDLPDMLSDQEDILGGETAETAASPAEKATGKPEEPEAGFSLADADLDELGSETKLEDQTPPASGGFDISAETPDGEDLSAFSMDDFGESDELEQLRENGAVPMTFPPEDTSYLEEDPLAGDMGVEIEGMEGGEEPAGEEGFSLEEASDDLSLGDISIDSIDESSLDLSQAVIDEPDLSAGITENPVEEPSLDDISLDMGEDISVDLDMGDDTVITEEESPDESDFSIPEDSDDISIDLSDDLSEDLSLGDFSPDDLPDASSFLSDDATAEDAFSEAATAEDAVVEEETEAAPPPDFGDMAELPSVRQGPDDEDFAPVIPEGFIVEAEDSSVPFDIESEPAGEGEVAPEDYAFDEGGDFSPDEPAIDEPAIDEPADEPAVGEPDVEPAGESDAEPAGGDFSQENLSDDGLEIPSNIKQELKTVLSYMDQLLESLPDEKIEEFAKSEYFDTYKKLFKELGLV
jgi:hypothetical protein